MNDKIQALANWASKNQGNILTGLACIGVPTTAYLASKATLDSYKTLEDVASRSKKKPTNKEILRMTWKNYISTVVVGGATIGCMIGSNSTHLKREAALTSAYILSDTAFKEYRAKVVEKIGEKKNEIIENDVIHEKVIQNPPTENTILLLNSDDDTLVYDKVSGRYFKSSMEKLRRIENDANKDLLDSLWISLNDVYFLMDLPPISIGDELGWDINATGYIDFKFGSTLLENGEPCMTLDFHVSPRHKYYY